MHIERAHQLWKKHLKSQSNIIDATCGNGHDTLFLAQNTQGKIFVYDIQEKALRSAKNRLLENLDDLQRVTFLKACHSSLDSVPQKLPIDLIVYNLGYLPGADKKVTTKVDTTLLSIQHALDRIEGDGAISITCYPGHSEGEREEKAILSFFEKYDGPRTILYHWWLKRAKSPTLIWVH